METTSADSWSDMAQPCDMDLWVMKLMLAWSIFHGPVILSYIWKTINVWPQNKCRSLWPVFHGPVILPYILKAIWCMNILIMDYESVWPDVWPQNKRRSLWPIFHGPMILHYILKIVWCMNIILWDYGSVWPDIWPKQNVGLCDLYFMVCWFCLMSPRLVDTWASYFQIMRHSDPNFDLKVNTSQHDLYFMV